jgi:hypothetical protein
MSLKTQAKKIQKAGHKNSMQDSMLAHISPKEAGLLQMFGGSGRTDPNTGMPHFDGDTDTAGQGDVGVDSGSNDPGISGLSAYGEDQAYNAGLRDPTDTTLGPYDGTPDQSIEVTGQRGYDTPGMYGEGDLGDNPGLMEQATRMATKAKRSYNQLHPAIRGFLSMAHPAFAALNAVNAFANMAEGGKRGASTALGMFGNELGRGIGIPGAGVALGAGLSQFGGAMANSTAPEGATGANPGGLAGGGGGLLDSAVNLGGLLYGSNKFNKGSNQQINDLQSMYGPNSAYAQQMQKTLEARDAASGRRSQYGPRSVELQAALAAANSRNAPTLAGLHQQQATQRWKQQQALMFLYQQMGGAKGIGRGLNSMFPQAPMPDFSTPQTTPYDPGFNLNSPGGINDFMPPDVPDFGP